MESNYYTPDIEEFHRGFDFYILDGNPETEKWNPRPTNFTDNQLIEMIEAGIVKVKYLDREDIESLGFEHNPHYSNGFYGYTSKDVNTMIAHQFIDLSKDTTKITILKNKKTCHLGGSLWEPIFVGKIKNKSELKRILKQIGYEN